MIMLRRLLARALAARGLEIVPGPTTHEFVRERGVDLVLDVGAGSGRYARGLRDLGFKGFIHSVEPAALAYAALRRAARGDRKWTVSQCAVGAREGPAVMATTPDVWVAAPEGQDPMQATDAVRMLALDHLAANLIAKTVLLRIGAAGAEDAILHKARNTLRRSVGVQLRLPVEPLTDTGWRLQGALARMEELGFVPAQIRRASPRAGRAGSAATFDCLFARPAGRPGRRRRSPSVREARGRD